MSSRLLPIISDGMPAATSTFSMPRFSSPSDSASVLPHSCVTSLAISLKFASRSALRRKSGWMRSPAGVRRHACSAFDAAFTALATSAADDNGAAASVSPVAGLRTGVVWAADAASHRPPTKFMSVSCPIIPAPSNSVHSATERGGAEARSLISLRHDDGPAHDLPACQRLIAGIRLIQGEPLRDHGLWPEDALRREPDDLRHVAAGAGAVRSDDAQLATDEPRDLDWCRRLARRDADGHHAAAVANHVEGLGERLRQAEHLERDVHTLAVGQLAHARSRVACRGVDDVGGAETHRSIEFVVANINRDDLRGAERFRDLDDVDAYAACGDDGDALATTQSGAVTDCTIRGEDGAAEHRRLFEWQAVGQREDVCRRHDRIFREAGHRVHRDGRSVLAAQPRGAVVERALQPVHREEAVAEIVASRAAGGAEPARHDERRRDLAAHWRSGDTGPERRDDARS